MKCQLTSKIGCSFGNEATTFIRWTMRWDPDPEICTSVVCDRCLERKPDMVLILEQRPVKEGDHTSV